MNVTTTTRDIKELNPLVQVMLEVALKKIKKKNIVPLIVETYRPKERQYYLYGKGRFASTCANAGMPLRMAKKYANPKAAKCTWTLNSIHIKRCAVDLIPQRGGKAIWNSNDPDTKQIISIMQSVGFEAGANWKTSPDSPHFQVKGISGKALTKKNTTKFLTKVIQTKLSKKGYYVSYVIDGEWGKATDNAVKKWRKDQGWSAKASIGTEALRKLLNY